MVKKVAETKEQYVYKRSDGRWEARYLKGYSADGKKIYSAVYAKTKAEAIKKRKELIGPAEEKQKIPTQLNLLIIGAGSHGKNVREVAESLRIFSKISFLDDKVTGDGVIGTCKEAAKFRNEYICAFVAIGDSKKRKKFAKFLKERNFLMPSIIATTATVSPKAVIGEGVAILPQSTVNEPVIGDFCILASNSLVNNEVTLGDYSHVDCGGIVLKGKKVPEGTWIKSGEIYGNKGV